MAKVQPPVSDAELEVLKALWADGPGTVRDVGARLRRGKRRWAYTTVQTLLNRLLNKGCVACDKRTVPHVFQASVSREGLMRRGLNQLADDLCDGTATPLVAALVRGSRFSKEELDSFRRLLDEAEPHGR